MDNSVEREIRFDHPIEVRGTASAASAGTCDWVFLQNVAAINICIPRADCRLRFCLPVPNKLHIPCICISHGWLATGGSDKNSRTTSSFASVNFPLYGLIRSSDY